MKKVVSTSITVAYNLKKKWDEFLYIVVNSSLFRVVLKKRTSFVAVVSHSNSVVVTKDNRINASVILKQHIVEEGWEKKVER